VVLDVSKSVADGEDGIIVLSFDRKQLKGLKEKLIIVIFLTYIVCCNVVFF